MHPPSSVDSPPSHTVLCVAFRLKPYAVCARVCVLPRKPRNLQITAPGGFFEDGLWPIALGGTNHEQSFENPLQLECSFRI